MPDTAASIDVYHERSLFGRCQFTLFADWVELVGRKNFNLDFENRFPLDDLSPEISKTRLRHPW